MLLLLAIADKHYSAEHYEQVVKHSRAGITQTLHQFLTLLYICPVFTYQGTCAYGMSLRLKALFGIVRSCFSQKT